MFYFLKPLCLIVSQASVWEKQKQTRYDLEIYNFLLNDPKKLQLEKKCMENLL